MTSFRRTLAALVAVATLLPGAIAAQSAQDVLNRMLAEHERRAAGITDYTVVNESMGMTVTMYFVKDDSGPHPVFRLKDTKVSGMAAMAVPQDDASEEFWDHLPEFMERASYEGRETVDGHAVDVIAIKDFNGLDFGNSVGGRDADFEPSTASFYVDRELSVPRRMVIAGTLKREGRTADVTAHIDMQDYRDVDGLLHPFQTTVRVEGMADALDPKMRQQLQEMKKQLADMPEQQRQMMQQMMGGQLAALEKMVGDDGSMTFELVAREVRVNAGPPK